MTTTDIGRDVERAAEAILAYEDFVQDRVERRRKAGTTKGDNQERFPGRTCAEILDHYYEQSPALWHQLIDAANDLAKAIRERRRAEVESAA